METCSTKQSFSGKHVYLWPLVQCNWATSLLSRTSCSYIFLSSLSAKWVPPHAMQKSLHLLARQRSASKIQGLLNQTPQDGRASGPPSSCQYVIGTVKPRRKVNGTVSIKHHTSKVQTSQPPPPEECAQGERKNKGDDYES